MERLVFLTIFCLLLASTQQKPSFLITAPNVVHLGAQETVTIQVHGAKSPVHVTAYFKDEVKNRILSDRINFNLNQGNNYQEIRKIMVKPGNLQQDMFKRSKNPHVVLVTESRELHKEAVQNIRILLSSKRGYIFIQTDKPIYTPNSKVYTTISQSTENAERELCKERSSPSPLRTWSVAEENCLMSQRQPVPPTDKDLQSSREKISFSCPGDTTKNDAVGELSQSSDLLGQIAELTRQNSIIKAQLSKFRSFSEDVSDCLPQPDPMQNSNSCPDSSQGQAHLVVPKSLEERIAELNRQSTEARDKLLQLIDQQKLAAADTVSQRIPPVLSPARNYTENARRTIEVSVPVAASVDSPKEDSVSPGSVTSMRRSVGGSSKPSSPLSTTSESVTLNPVSQRPKAEKQKEEGWFALSMHIM